MGTHTTKNWRQQRSFAVPAHRLSTVVCHKSINPMVSLELGLAIPANERRDYLGSTRVTSSA